MNNNNKTRETNLNTTKEVKLKKDEINYKEKYLLVLAEMENLRKRLEMEKGEIIKYSSSSLISNILPTLDMLELAINSNNVSDEIKNWLKGFEMILSNFKEVLKSEGVTEIQTKVGDDFNSDIHFAIEERDAKEIKKGKIVSIKNKGYLIHDRLLRPVTVVVAK